MLKEFIQYLEQSPQPINSEEKVRQITQTFDGIVDLLRNPETFPNEEINRLTTLMWRLVGNKIMNVVLDPTYRMPSVSFAVLVENAKQFPLIFLPNDFVEITKEAPEVQIGAIAYMGSQCRDYIMGKITGDNSEEVNHRAQAYEAEALLTMGRIAEQEGLSLRLIPFQKRILEMFPDGLLNLEESLKYTTPDVAI